MKKQKFVKSPERFIKIRVRNMDRKRGEKFRKIPVTEADGTVIGLADGFEGEVSEYVYNSLSDAIETLYFYAGTEKNINNIESKQYPRFDVIKLSDFYEKGKPEKEIKSEEPESKKRVIEKPKKTTKKTLEPALAGA